jgi:putative membrane protein
LKNNISLALKGVAMGIAETIPGVSGGTIAFISGIYDELLETIKAFNPSLVTTFKKEGVGAVWKKIHGNFLFFLLSGMVVGILIGLVAISYFLSTYPPVVWAFFFGLIVASVVYIGKQIKNWNFSIIIAMIIGAAIAYGLTLIPVAQTNESLWFVFICGAVAVSALILPGVSGSFVLLILGMYSYILHDTLKEGVLTNFDPQAIITMVVFALGMVLGLATFARFLSWALHKYHNFTLSLLTGFMIGALYKLWPWRVPVDVVNSEDQIVPFTLGMEVEEVIKDVNVLPADYLIQMGESPYVIAVIISVIVGFTLVLFLEYSGEKKVS